MCNQFGQHLKMRAAVVVMVVLASLALSSSLQSMPDSAVAEPLRLLLEVAEQYFAPEVTNFFDFR